MKELDYDETLDEEEIEEDHEPEDNDCEATDEEYDRIADAYERKIYGDDLE